MQPNNPPSDKVLIRYLIDLISNINPYNQEELVILATYDTKIQKKVICSLNGKTQQNTFQFNSRTNTPKQIPWIHSTAYPRLSIANCNEYFLCHSNQSSDLYSFLNILYLFSLSQKIRIIFVISDEDTKQQGKTKIINILKWLGATFCKCSNAQGGNQLPKIKQRLINSIGFLIENAKEEISLQSYIARIKKIEGSKVLNHDNSIGRLLLKSVIEKEKVFLLHSKNQNALGEIQAKLPSLELDHKFLTGLFKYSCSSDVQAELYNEINALKNSTTGILDNLSHIITDRILYESDQQQILSEIISTIPLAYSFNSIKLWKADNRNVPRQEPITIFMSLCEEISYLQENAFQISEQYENYFPNNQEAANWQYVCNQSLHGNIFKIFSNTLIYNINPNQRSLCSYGQFLQICLRLFQFLPQIDYRKFQLEVRIPLQEMLLSIIQYLSQQFDFDNYRNKKLPPKHIRRMIEGLEITIQIIKATLFKDRVPFSIRRSELENRLFMLSLKLIETKWHHYLTIKRFLTVPEVNYFFLNFYDHIEVCKDHLEAYKLEETLQMVRKMYEHFGDFCMMREFYILAIQFYEAAMMYNKIQMVYQKWFDKKLKSSAQVDLLDIEQGINTFVKLGLVQTARKWCYKFMEKFEYDKYSYMVKILSSISSKIGEQEVHEHFIADAIPSKVILVKKESMEEIRATIPQKSW